MSYKTKIRKKFPDAYCVKLNDGSGYIVWPGKVQPRGLELPAIGTGTTPRQAWVNAHTTVLYALLASGA